MWQAIVRPFATTQQIGSHFTVAIFNLQIMFIPLIIPIKAKHILIPHHKIECPTWSNTFCIGWANEVDKSSILYDTTYNQQAN